MSTEDKVYELEPKQKDIIQSQSLQVGDISTEQWREYNWTCPKTGNSCSKKFHQPLQVAWREGGTTHRVKTDDKTWTLVPAPGVYGCTVTWKGDQECNW